jgi:UDP-glucose 4-epimerase
MTRTLILGSTGFIGTAVSAELKKRGLAYKGLGSRDLDLTKPESAEKLAALVDEDAIIVVAARVNRPDPQLQFADDIAVVTNVSDALARRRAKLCVFVSSTSVYGSAAANLDVTEETPVDPGSLYAISKFTGEHLLRLFCARAGTPLLTLRPAMVYGPGDPGTGYGPGRFVRSALKSGEIELFDDGGEIRDYLYIDDLARIAVDLSQAGAHGIFNVACGETPSFADIAAELERIAGKKIGIVRLPRRVPRIDQRLNVEKLRAALPGLRFTSFAAGLEKAYAAAALPA